MGLCDLNTEEWFPQWANYNGDSYVVIWADGTRITSVFSVQVSENLMRNTCLNTHYYDITAVLTTTSLCCSRSWLCSCRHQRLHFSIPLNLHRSCEIVICKPFPVLKSQVKFICIAPFLILLTFSCLICLHHWNTMQQVFLLTFKVSCSSCLIPVNFCGEEFDLSQSHPGTYVKSF